MVAVVSPARVVGGRCDTKIFIMTSATIKRFLARAFNGSGLRQLPAMAFAP